MNRFRILIAVVGLSLAALLVAQQTTTSSSTSRSTGGGGSSTSTASGSSSSSSSKSSSAHASGNSSKSGNASGNGSGSGSGFGFQGKPSHAIFFHLNQEGPVNDQVLDTALQQETKYMNDLRMKGKVLLFGPWRDQPGSMAIVLVKDDEEANAIARNHPAVRSGNLFYEVRAWNVK